jgi:hypothetical protein
MDLDIINELEREVEQKRQAAREAEAEAQEAAYEAERAQQWLDLIRTAAEGEKKIREIRDQINEAEETLARLKSAPSLVRHISLGEPHRTDMNHPPFLRLIRERQKPLLVLPKLLPDHSDVDPACRDHLDPQADQIISVLRALSSPANPMVKSEDIKKYILENFEIQHQDYWMVKTGPKEPERWWKNIYDKAIERLDLVLNKVARRNRTGKKGVYALVEYLPSDQMEFWKREYGMDREKEIVDSMAQEISKELGFKETTRYISPLYGRQVVDHRESQKIEGRPG